jgi:hypothetical protein
MVAKLVSLMEGNSSDIHTKFCEDFLQTLQERRYLPLINNESRLKKKKDLTLITGHLMEKHNP